jgi:hypothetical protein
MVAFAKSWRRENKATRTTGRPLLPTRVVLGAGTLTRLLSHVPRRSAFLLPTEIFAAQTWADPPPRRKGDKPGRGPETLGEFVGGQPRAYQSCGHGGVVMTGRMDWRRARLAGRRTLDHRHEHDTPDRAERWLQRAERRRQPERRNIAPSRRPGNWTTANSTEVPW